MSSLKDKTPSESYKDILNIGSEYQGLTNYIQYFNDGSGNQLPIGASSSSIDINFNGGAITNHSIRGSVCKNYSLVRAAHSDVLNLVVGQPSIYILMSYFTPEIVDSSIPGRQRTLINIKKPLIGSEYVSIPYYSYSDLYLFQSENPSPAIRYQFQPEAGLIQLAGGNLNTTYDISAINQYDLLRIEIWFVPDVEQYFYRVNLIKQNIFGF